MPFEVEHPSIFILCTLQLLSLLGSLGAQVQILLSDLPSVSVSPLHFLYILIIVVKLGAVVIFHRHDLCLLFLLVLHAIIDIDLDRLTINQIILHFVRITA